MMSLCNQRHCLKIPCVKLKKGLSDLGFLENLKCNQNKNLSYLQLKSGCSSVTYEL